MIKLGYEQKRRIGFTHVLDLVCPASPYGEEALRQTRPAYPGQEEQLRRELQNIERTLAAQPRAETAYTRIEQVFTQTKDIRASIARIGGEIGEVDLFEIKRFLLQLAEIAPLFEEVDAAANYDGVFFGDTAPALELLDPEGSRVATFHISSRYFPVLEDVRTEKKETERKLRAASSDEERTALLKRRSELAAREQQKEDLARAMLSEKLLPWRETLIKNADTIGRLDLLIQKAKLAAKHGGCMPKIGGNEIRFKEMSNPQIADMLAGNGGAFSPLTLELQTGAAVITGANMGGKSVALRTLALNVLLIHYGFYPFALEADCPLFDSIHLVSEDLEAADRGLSSFGGEILRLQEVLIEIGEGRTLVLLDEFARGTNPAEGGTIARGVCAYLNTQNAYTVMTTHYEGVAALADVHYQVAGLRRMKNSSLLSEDAAGTPVEERVAMIAGYMDYGLLRVSAGERLPMDAVNICRLLGLKEEIIKLIDSFESIKA